MGVATARLDLDEYRHTEARGDEIDLAHRRAEAPGANRIKLEPQEPRVIYIVLFGLAVSALLIRIATSLSRRR